MYIIPNYLILFYGCYPSQLDRRKKRYKIWKGEVMWNYEPFLQQTTAKKWPDAGARVCSVSWDWGKQGFNNIMDVERSFCKEKEDTSKLK